jgi:hypothetical protein
MNGVRAIRVLFGSTPRQTFAIRGRTVDLLTEEEEEDEEASK